MIRRFARPYARALMDAAGSPQNANAIRGELLGFASSLRNSPELQALYTNPGVTPEQKTAVTNSIAKKLKVSELGTKFLHVLVSGHRINDLDAILAAIQAYVNQALGVEVARVRSAKTLTPDEMEQLAKTLADKVGRKIELDIRTDPSLLGGFVAQVGSEIYDASVAGKINKFKESLT